MHVTENPDTDDQLLARLRDPEDREAWYEFVTIYRPLIHRIGRSRGLQDADIHNLIQEVLHKVGRHIVGWSDGQFDGSFRRWLATVARNAAIDSLRRIRPDSPRGGTSIHQQLREVPQRDESEAELRHELEREAFRWAARRIRDEFTDTTWAAFWQTMVDGISCDHVAEELGKSIGAIYTARSRVMQRLKQELTSFEWEDMK